MDKNNDKLFDDFFSKGFDNDSYQVKPEKQDWEALATRLDRHQGKQNNTAWSWLWLLLPLLLLFQMWTAYQWHQTRKKLDSFIEANRQKNTGVITDTISNVVSTTYYDTIYKTVIIEQKIFRTTHKEQQPEHPGKEKASQKDETLNIQPATTPILVAEAVNPIQKIDKNEQHDKSSGIKQEENSIIAATNPKTFVQNTPTANRDTSNEKEAINRQLSSADKPITIPESAAFSSEKDNQPTIKADSADNRNKSIPNVQGKPDKTLADFMANQKPRSAWDTFLDNIIPNKDEHSWRYSIAAGSILPITRGEIDIINPFSLQVNVEWLAGKHISVLPSLSYAQYEFEAEQPFLTRLGIPQPEKLADNVPFSEAEGIQRYIMPSLQIRYRIRPDKTWTWYVGTGVTAFIPQRIDIEYDYLDEDLTEITTIVSGYKPKTKFACLNLHGGIQYNVNQSASIFADIHTIWDLRRSDRGFHYINPQLGVKFFIK